MQKLIFETTKGRIELSDTGPFILSNLDLGQVEKDTQTTKMWGQHGVSSQGGTLGPRLIRAKCTILTRDEEELFTMRRILGKYLNPALKGLLYYDNGFKTYRIEAMVDHSVVFSQWLGKRRGQFFTVHFYCQNPLFTNGADTVKELVQVTPKFKFPLAIRNGFIFSSLGGGRILAENQGDCPCPVKIEIQGPAKNPVITNETTGEFIGIDLELGPGQGLFITTGFGNKRISLLTNGEMVQALNYVNPQSTFFWLMEGENVISFNNDTGYDLARAKLIFSPGYFNL